VIYNKLAFATQGNKEVRASKKLAKYFPNLKETTTKSIAILLLITPKQNTLLESPSKTSENKMQENEM
jgi:hypothetical protein